MQNTHSSAENVLLAGTVTSAVGVRYRPELFQPILQSAKESGRAECLCVSPPLRLVVKRKNQKLHLAAWPAEAHLHGLGCPFYSAEAQYAKAAHDNGVKHVDGNESIATYKSPWLAQPSSDAHKAEVEDSDGAVRLWGIVHELWASSRLNCWAPGWRRDWMFVRAVLLRSAENFVINGEPLSGHLYVPPVFSRERKVEINASWHEFVSPLLASPRGSQCVATAFVLGCVVELEPVARGYMVRLQNHYQKVFVGKNMFENLSRMSRRGLQELRMPPGNRADVIAMLRVEALSDGGLVAADCVLMRVASRFIPSNYDTEDHLIDLMLREGREFLRPLSYAQSHGELPSFVLRDTSPETELTVTGAGFPVHKLDGFAKQCAQSAKARGKVSWFWNKLAPMPPLPQVSKKAGA